MFHPSILRTYTAMRELQQVHAVDAVFDTCEMYTIDSTAFVEFLCIVGHYDVRRIAHLA